MLLAAMRTRGCKEEMVPSPELLAEGKVRAPARRGCRGCRTLHEAPGLPVRLSASSL